MLFNNVLDATVLAFASVEMASPVPISGDIASANIESANAGPVIEARQRVVPKPSGPVPGAPNKGSVATAITGIAEKVVNLIQSTIDKDLEGRRKFTVDVARGTASLFPGRGVVVCNVDFSTTGNIVHRQTVRYNQKIGATVTFEVAVLGPGATFTRQGDCGYENWAYAIPSPCRAGGETVSC